MTTVCGQLDRITVETLPALSPNRYASRHARSDGRPIVRSAELGEDWSWCYLDEVAFVWSVA